MPKGSLPVPRQKEQRMTTLFRSATTTLTLAGLVPGLGFIRILGGAG
jgi:hypothetical protein